MYTTLEATLERKNSLSPTGTRVYLHLNLIEFLSDFPHDSFFFSLCTIAVRKLTSPSYLPKRGKMYQVNLEQILKLNFFMDEILLNWKL